MSLANRLKNLIREIWQKFGPAGAVPIVLLVLGITIIILFSSLFPSCDSTVTLEEALDDLEFSPLEIFPVDLELYFSNENSDASRNEILTGHQALLMPLTIHLGTNHPEGNWKWYLYARNREYEVLAPGEAVIKSSELDRGSSGVVEVEGNQVYEDGSITLWFDEEKQMNFGHINLLKSLADRVPAVSEEESSEEERFIVVEQGEKIGYTMIDSALDITMLDSDVPNGLSPIDSDNPVRFNVCPLGYFSRDMQTQINRDYYNYVYTKMKEGGMWPESDLCNPIDIHIDGTIWGNWWFKSGPIPYFDERFYHYYSFPYGLVVFLSKDKTNPATYQLNPRPPHNSIDVECLDWRGLYVDYDGITEASNLEARYVELVPGSGSFSSSGILVLKSFNNVTDESQTKYVQFSLDLNDAGQFDDELSLKFYDTLDEAEGDGSFLNPIVYIRNMDEGDSLPLD